MISIEAHRAAIGSFLEKARNLTRNAKMNNFFNPYPGENQEGHFLQKFVYFIVIIIL